MLAFYNKKNSHRTNSVFFLFLLLSYTFAYLHFYTIIRMMVVRASKPSNERECGIYRKKEKEKESEYPISCTHIALYVM